ncbi:MAG: RNA 3'-terminal phosphate cyclase, partial [Candidatus Bilamarchaeaceae archaeon]
MITIDGSVGESGGQILRTALTLSAITGKEFEIVNIRAGRPNPGLAMQHLTAVKAVRSICRGKLEGAEIGSRTLKFFPGEIVGGRYDFNIGTAGSVILVAQTVLPILLYAKKKSVVRITGGTHVMKSPGYDYFEKVFLPAVRSMGAIVESKLLKSGYYPKGGGEIEMEIEPSTLHGKTKWEKESEVHVIIRLGSLPLSIAMREKKIFLQNDINDVAIREEETLSPGNAVTIWSGYRGAYVPGEKGKRAEVVAQEALDAFKAENGDVDRHLADQLLLFGAL